MSTSDWPNWRSFTIKNRVSTRSACPHNKGVPPDGAGGNDTDQKIDKDAITTLVMKRVKYLISANPVKLKSKEQADLKTAKIGYKWLPVDDWHAPNEKQFREAHKAYKKHTKGVHFYCGWGNGRTGSYITGIEILEGVYPDHRPNREDYDRNFVDNDTQRKALDALWDSWKRQGALEEEGSELMDEDDLETEFTEDEEQGEQE
ncbi:hypothetical protein BDW22DRAFT_1362734 [Trametopsis cervina]|nr:hypothetical protein BDW22DRAFT_1362734 [Trametopsis cervina]